MLKCGSFILTAVEIFRWGFSTVTILSIHSHVAFGHVGNAAAVFPLQRLGREVWPIHTVLFSNHPGYGAFKGPILPSSTIRDQVDGLEALGVLDRCSAVLSGYLGDASVGAAVADAVARVKALNSEAIHVCDPVMGDDGPGLYVAEDIPSFIRRVLIPGADVAIPNRFELSLLTGMPAATLEEALAAARALMALGPRIVLTTSLERPDGPEGCIEMLLVEGDEAWIVATPKLDFPVAPNGSGDATAALFTAFYLESRDAALALTWTASSIYSLMSATLKSGGRELALIAGQERLANPERIYDAWPVD